MSFVATWVLLAALWIGLSGFFDGIHLTYGFAAVTLVSALSHKHLSGARNLGLGLTRLARLFLYVPWLLWQIVLANVDVMLRILGVREIDPLVIRFRPEVESDFGVATLANSITLTPGTVTVEIADGEFIVHALSREAADGVLTRVMENKVKRVEGGA